MWVGLARRGGCIKEVLLRRHLPVLAHAFRFYGAWVFGLTVAASVVGSALVGLLIDGWLAALVAVPAMSTGALIGAAYVGVARGLDARRPWARWAGLGLSALAIGDLPFGMALGLLGLGVLTDQEVAACFDDPTVAPTHRLPLEA